MVSAIRYDHITAASFTITLASLASSTTGVGRQSTLIDNDTNWYGAAMIYLRIKVGTTPSAPTPIRVYLLRSDDDATTPIRTDGAGASDAGITIVNADPLGIILCSATTTGALYEKEFDTEPFGPLGPQWGIALVQETGVNLDSTESNHIKRYRYYNPEGQ